MPESAMLKTGAKNVKVLSDPLIILKKLGAG